MAVSRRRLYTKSERREPPHSCANLRHMGYCKIRPDDMTLISRRAIFEGLIASVLGTRPVLGQTRVLSKPKPLAKDAVTHDWTAFLGPTHNATSTETRLSRTLPPPLIWEFTKGTGYASPAIAGERLVFLHRLGDEEIVECLHAETGATHWQFRYPTDFEDRYGYNNGPRSSPVIDARARVHGGRARAAALPRPRNRKSDLETRPGKGVSRPSGFFRDGVDAPD